MIGMLQNRGPMELEEVHNSLMMFMDELCACAPRRAPAGTTSRGCAPLCYHRRAAVHTHTHNRYGDDRGPARHLEQARGHREDRLRERAIPVTLSRVCARRQHGRPHCSVSCKSNDDVNYTPPTR